MRRIFNFCRKKEKNDLEQKLEEQAETIKVLKERLDDLAMKVTYSCCHHKKFTYYSVKDYSESSFYNPYGNTTIYWNGHEREINGLLLSEEAEITKTDDEGVVRIIDNHPPLMSSIDDKREYLVNLVSGKFWIV